jgi:N-acetyl-gamma-glutamylphosphate reductase
MSIRIDIVGISGFGGGEAMRLVANHPSFELIYAAGEGSAGSRWRTASPVRQPSWPKWWSRNGTLRCSQSLMCAAHG